MMRKPSGAWEIAAVVIVAAVAVGAAIQGFRSFGLDRARAAAGLYMRQKLADEVQPVNVTNCRLARFGEANDGGYVVCENLLADVKTGYSYGISGFDGWGCDISKKLGVTVHQYDCFDVHVPACPDGATVFHPECVGTTRAVEDGRPFDSMGGQFARNGDGSKHLVVKIDVEGAEWDAFDTAPDSLFERIDQLVVEFHHADRSWSHLRTIQRLKRFFVVAHLHYNNYSCDRTVKPLPAWAMEVLLVNRRLARTDGTPAPAGPTSLDAPNNPDGPDCQSRVDN